MSRASRLEPIAEFAGQVEDEAARRLVATASVIQTKELELTQLRSYLAEYRQRLSAEQQSTDSLRWQNGRAFLSRLCAAVAGQEAELQKVVERYRLETERWRESYRRSKSLDQVIERGHRETRHELQKRAQAELDEQALRRTLGGQ